MKKNLTPGPGFYSYIYSYRYNYSDSLPLRLFANSVESLSTSSNSILDCCTRRKLKRIPLNHKSATVTKTPIEGEEMVLEVKGR